MADIVELELGTDLFLAEIIVAALRSEGLEVQLVSFHATAGHPGIAPSFGQQHRVLVHREDQEVAQEIITEALNAS
jgi:Putative prokaryotic signal transducing protein